MPYSIVGSLYLVVVVEMPHWNIFNQKEYEFLTFSYEIFFNGFQMKSWEFLTFSWEQYMVNYLTKYLSTMKAKKFDQLDIVSSI